MKTAVISGVAGQDGAYLAGLLLNKSYQVIGILPHDRNSDLIRLDFLGIKTKIQFRKVNLLSEADVKKLLLEETPDEFYNLAAVSSVGLSFIQPMATFDFNTKSVLNILEAIRLVSPKTKFYQASSSEMFGNIGKSRLPIKESFLFHPVSPYGISKASAHWLTVNYREAYNLQACCGILFNHESALRPTNFVIKKIIQTAVQIKNGSNQYLELGNISIVRDWGYAPYYVDAMWRMLQQDELRDYIICSGNSMRLEDIVKQVFESLGLDIGTHLRLTNRLLRSLELETIYGDNSRAKKELGWEYTMSQNDLIKILIKDEIEFMEWKEGNIKLSSFYEQL